MVAENVRLLVRLGPVSERLPIFIIRFLGFFRMNSARWVSFLFGYFMLIGWSCEVHLCNLAKEGGELSLS